MFTPQGWLYDMTRGSNDLSCFICRQADFTRVDLIIVFDLVVSKLRVAECLVWYDATLGSSETAGNPKLNIEKCVITTSQCIFGRH